ncbi:aspartate kinase [Demequina lignilytica]|uniref:Aspartokinase n=1 Tax=Demequina lignilytica TaxID=3051663 RepID=A0AAW7M8J1_9MICO|nr:MULTISPECIES: aspartate kinase [unclassified Demequina]MDN4479236.1 aspartate kinase [Demequina sp. SYSU T00039-1]MDN4484462.1 aspartate kinase [Demequina sp. SYSU T0a273]MDN4487905.1 aspartate kinase [Demequina sp. SYSU T00039]MDN4491711.1 aspartate kinase [Demequina sp. SYSU T00068]
MSLVVQKYGGSSVADAAAIRRVAARVVDTVRAGNDVVVTVSAMGDTTDELIDLANEVTTAPDPREMDILLTAGERISMALLAMAINSAGIPAQAFTGPQAGVITTEHHGRARIIDVAPGRLQRALSQGRVAIVAGFQGLNQETQDVTTLGRGGSDTTAVALAAALGADVCEIYTDVDGVFTADPRIVPAARKLTRITYEEMLDLAASGAKVLMPRCVEYARRFNVPVHVRSSFSGLEGTWVTDGTEEGDDMEDPIIAGVAHDRSEAKITVTGVPDVPGSAARLFEAVARADVNIDMIVQNVSATNTGVTDISFTLPQASIPAAIAAIEGDHEGIGYAALATDDTIGKISLVGAGMRSNSGVSAKFFAALRDAGVNIEMITTSDIRISVVTRDADLEKGVKAVHTAFDLDSTEGEAVVYGGTGR